MLYYAQPFIRDVFLQPMEKLDPRGKRLREAFKRSQLLGMKERSSRRPFTRFTRALQVGFEHPVLKPLLGKVFVRLSGVGPDFLARLYSEEELARARRMSYEALADEALGAKQEN